MRFFIFLAYVAAFVVGFVWTVHSEPTTICEHEEKCEPATIIHPVSTTSHWEPTTEKDLPPKRYNHWPSIPVLILVLPVSEIDEQCAQEGWYKKGRSAHHLDVGCEIDASHIRAAMDLTIVVSPEEAKRIVHFIDKTIDSSETLYNYGCIVLLPNIGRNYSRAPDHDFIDISPHEQYITYRHELGHCNGWGRNHEK